VRHDRLRVHLVGVAGTSRDILLATFALASTVMGDPELRDAVELTVRHYPYILPADSEKGAETVAADCLDCAADVVGFSTYTWNYDVIVRTAAILRKKSPGTKIVLGGPEIAAADLHRGRFADLPIDFLVIGEGEVPLVELLGRLCTDRDADGRGIPRTAWRRGDELVWEAIDDPSLALVDDLSALPSAYLSGAVPERLLARPGVQANVETQRGCTLRCAYCLYHASYRTVRYRDPEVVIAEIEYLHDHGVRDFRITDANFLSRKAHAATILEALIERDVHMSFFVEVIPSFLDAEVADLLRRFSRLSPANHVLVGIGLQTTNKPSLVAIRRRLPIEHFSRAYEALSSAGVIIKTDVIVGLPYETRTSFFQTLEFVAGHMRSGFNFLSIAVLRVLPGTELAAVADTAGLSVTDDSEHFVSETPTMPREDMVDCLRMSTVATRLFHTLEDEDRLRVRDRYFAVHDALGVSHAQVLEYLSAAFLRHLTGSDADYAQPDFADAEHYWSFDVHRDLTDELVLRELDALERDGIRP